MQGTHARMIDEVLIVNNVIVFDVDILDYATCYDGIHVHGHDIPCLLEPSRIHR